MLLLTVRRPDQDHALLHELFTDREHTYCCRKAAMMAERLRRAPRWPRPGLACVTVLQLPDDLPLAMSGKRWNCATIIFQAYRAPFRYRQAPPPVVVAIAPPGACSGVSAKCDVDKPLEVDIRSACLDGLPPELRAIVPEKPRAHKMDDL